MAALAIVCLMPVIAVGRWDYQDGTPSVTDDLGRDAADYRSLESFVTQAPYDDEVSARLTSDRQKLCCRIAAPADTCHVHRAGCLELRN